LIASLEQDFIEDDPLMFKMERGTLKQLIPEFSSEEGSENEMDMVN
jgi:hypothetical protein